MNKNTAMTGKVYMVSLYIYIYISSKLNGTNQIKRILYEFFLFIHQLFYTYFYTCLLLCTKSQMNCVCVCVCATFLDIIL